MAAPRELSLRHPRGVTAILVGAGVVEAAAERLGEWLAGRTVFVVSTPRVLALHGARLEWIDAGAARRVTLEVPEGEAAKTVSHAEGLWRRMLAAGGKRDSRVIAFGGGSVGDLAGFAAGCFLRGVGVRASADDPAGAGRRRHGRQDRCRPAGRQEHGRPLPPPGGGDRRRRRPRHPAARGAAGGAGGGRQDGRAARCGAAGAGGRGPRRPCWPASRRRWRRWWPRPRPPRSASSNAIPTSGATGGCSTSATPSGTRWRAAAGYRGLRHGEAVAYGLLFALRLAVRRGLDGATAERLRRLLGRLELPPSPPLRTARRSPPTVSRSGSPATRRPAKRASSGSFPPPSAMGAWRTT